MSKAEIKKQTIFVDEVMRVQISENFTPFAFLKSNCSQTHFKAINFHMICCVNMC